MEILKYIASSSYLSLSTSVNVLNNIWPVYIFKKTNCCWGFWHWLQTQIPHGLFISVITLIIWVFISTVCHHYLKKNLYYLYLFVFNTHCFLFPTYNYLAHNTLSCTNIGTSILSYKLYWLNFPFCKTVLYIYFSTLYIINRSNWRNSASLGLLNKNNNN